MAQVQKKIKTSFWVKLVLAPVLMFSFAYLLVPIYDVLCDITGFNGKTGVISSGTNKYVIDDKREITLGFFASTMPGFAVDFKPKVAQMTVVPGQFYTTSYIARNNTSKEIIGQAVPSVAPTNAAVHFKKLECFCFQTQVFKPQETVEMAVRFVVEPAINKRIKDISLSYNFFKLDKKVVLKTTSNKKDSGLAL